MNEKDLQSRCFRWSVKLPARPEDFTAVRTSRDARDRAYRHRCCATVAMLLVFAAAGAAVGLSGIRREDAKNLATLRQTHLNQLSHGAGE